MQYVETTMCRPGPMQPAKAIATPQLQREPRVYIEDGYRKMRTAAPNDRAGSGFVNFARTTPELPTAHVSVSFLMVPGGMSHREVALSFPKSPESWCRGFPCVLDTDRRPSCLGRSCDTISWLPSWRLSSSDNVRGIIRAVDTFDLD
jgi:hypothetical protein